MFDVLIEVLRPRRWRTALIVGSALAHAGAIAGIALTTMWHVEKLEVASAPPLVAARLTVRETPPIVEREREFICVIPRPAPDPPRLFPPIVPPNVARGLRISGNERIIPPETVRVAMRRAGMDKLMATIKVCVNTDGRVDGLRILRSSSYRTYDHKLIREMRRWRYIPFRVDGRRSPMCSVSIFIYRR